MMWWEEGSSVNWINSLDTVMRNHLQVLRIFPHFHFFCSISSTPSLCSLEALRKTHKREEAREKGRSVEEQKEFSDFFSYFILPVTWHCRLFLHISFSLFSYFSFSLRRTTSLNVNKVLCKQFCAQFHIFTYPRLTPSPKRKIHLKSDGDVFCCFFCTCKLHFCALSEPELWGEKENQCKFCEHTQYDTHCVEMLSGEKMKKSFKTEVLYYSIKCKNNNVCVYLSNFSSLFFVWTSNEMRKDCIKLFIQCYSIKFQLQTLEGED